MKLDWKASVLVLLVSASLVGFLAVGYETGDVKVGVPPAVTPDEPGTVTVIPGLACADIPSESGIENIYFFVHGFGDDDEDNHFHWNSQGPAENENILEYNGTDVVITSSGGSVNVPADTKFDIVVAFKVHSSQVYDPTQTDNFRIEYIFSGAISDADNTTSVNMFCFDNDGTGTTWGRWVAVLNNGGEGYSLTAGSNFSIDNIALYGWK